MEPPAHPRYLPWQRDLLERALKLRASGRLPHAVLIENAGEQDISGFILYLATLLLCDQPDGIQTCGHCDACRMMQNGTYADFRLVTLEIDDKTKKQSKNIKIEQIRNLIHEVNLTHQFDRLKIAAIYPAESMNRNSANALLKTLEEPAPGVLLLLVTQNRGRIPITLRSRCQVWALHLPAGEDALAWLTGQGCSADDALRYLELASGDPVLALELQQQDYASLVGEFKTGFARFIRGELGVAALCNKLKSLDASSIRRLVDMILRAYCLQMSGIDAAAKPVDGADRERARALMDLQLRARQQLRVEENNLDLQLQLEDVLISLKQILSRRLI